MVVIQASVGSFGDGPRHIRCDVEGDTGVIGVDGDINLIGRECSCRSRLGEGNAYRFGPGPSVADSVRIAFLVVIEVFSSYVRVIC